MNFDAAFEKVIQHEGGYSAHPMEVRPVLMPGVD